jgi:hypothetical protein
VSRSTPAASKSALEHLGPEGLVLGLGPRRAVGHREHERAVGGLAGPKPPRRQVLRERGEQADSARPVGPSALLGAVRVDALSPSALNCSAMPTASHAIRAGCVQETLADSHHARRLPYDRSASREGQERPHDPRRDDQADPRQPARHPTQRQAGDTGSTDQRQAVQRVAPLPLSRNRRAINGDLLAVEAARLRRTRMGRDALCSHPGSRLKSATRAALSDGG